MVSRWTLASYGYGLAVALLSGCASSSSGPVQALVIDGGQDAGFGLASQPDPDLVRDAATTCGAYPSENACACWGSPREVSTFGAYTPTSSCADAGGFDCCVTGSGTLYVCECVNLSSAGLATCKDFAGELAGGKVASECP